jgi:hypothetical protein
MAIHESIRRRLARASRSCKRRLKVAKFDVVALAELKTRLPAKLLPLVEEFKAKLEKLGADQGGRLVPEKGEDVKDLRRALKAAAAALNRARPLSLPRRGRRAEFPSPGDPRAKGEARGGRADWEEAGAAEEDRIGAIR